MSSVSTFARRLAGASGIAVLAVAVPMAAASAATPKPSASCKVPVFSVSPLTAKPGSAVTVSGQNFSGCSAQGNAAKPTAVLTVQIGVETASKMGAVLATVKTTATGSFSTTITVPPLASGGVPKLALAAAATDPVTGLTYAGLAVLAYDVAGGGLPTVVPAGSGGQAAATSGVTKDAEFGLGVAGVLLVGTGAGLGLRRRRQH